MRSRALLASALLVPARALDIRWWSIEEGQAKATAAGLPLVVLMEKSWCYMCTRLIKDMQNHQAIDDVSD